MATIRPDRFVVLVAGSEPALMFTRQFTMQSPEIRVNASVGRGGSIQLELLDGGGRVIPGFEMAKCVPLHGDAIDHVVRWQGQPDVSQIVGKPIRWRLQATKARLYSVWMPDGDATVLYQVFRSAV